MYNVIRLAEMETKWAILITYWLPSLESGEEMKRPQATWQLRKDLFVFFEMLDISFRPAISGDRTRIGGSGERPSRE
jgi:hypothetical protein